MLSFGVDKNRALKFILFLAVLAACWYLGRIFKADVSYYQALLSKYPLALSGLIFVLLYVGTTTFVWLGPKDVLRISGAVLFGAYVSTVFVWVGEMVNAVVMFHLSRILGREYVRERFRVRSGELDKMKGDISALGVAAWRMNPLVPFRLIDLGYGLTQISFRKYFAAITAVSFIRILWLQFILAGIGTGFFEGVPAVLDYFLRHPLVIQCGALYFLAVAAVSILAVTARSLRKKKRGGCESAK